MKAFRNIHNSLLAAGLALLAGTGSTVAQSDRLDELLERLQLPDLGTWQLVEDEIYQYWSLSGSASADFLLMRGREALEQGDLAAALDHLTALTDHAPDFAEGWNARATAYFRAGRYGVAISDVQRVLALNPRHFGALTGLGLMLEEMGEFDAALEAYETAQSIHPHRPDISQAVDRLNRMLEGETL
ncbi:tetratricopeptide repeat protein [Rhodophyticola sp. CCM32]|uniref:tetratricopeptide repeat protein n=1 Tax=Rhodophyticola sp. CCM32 TaxID=2916397 RepID=UPI00107F4A5E|nr:tetratricopeptide repeat protein [Rhodophyticola sp. CCM32]QBY00201.1 tetratricopeptide repeat protein [Rhodophyticola sp. CCM32]